MTDEVFEKIINQIIPFVHKLKRVSLYRDGEPLIDKKLPQRIKRLKEIGVKEVSIATNVALLTPQISKALLSSGLDIIIMSIDSLDKRNYEIIRKRLVFEEVLSNALNFIKIRDKLKSNTRIWMRMIRQKDNFNDWDRYNNFWQSFLSDKDRIYFHNIFNWGGQLINFSPVSLNTEKSKPCVSLWSLMVIFADGKVPLCNVDYNNKYPTGDININSIKEIWNSEELKNRRNLHINNMKNKIDLCVNCNVWEEHQLNQPDYMST
jgi:radical SAM protein with 4Fe4S-binding SPASM domain